MNLRLLLTLALFAPAFLSAKTVLLCETDKPPVSYTAGETAVFSFTAQNGDKARVAADVTWKLEADFALPEGTAKTGSGTIPADAPLQVSVPMQGTGFVKLVMETTDPADGKKTTYYAGACADLAKIQGIPEPEDFDAFWTARKQEVQALDLSKATLEPVDLASMNLNLKNFNSNADYYICRIPMGEGAAPATAYVSMPKGAEPGSLPLVFQYNGYGWGGSRPNGWSTWQKCILFQVNAHGFELGRPGEYYKEFEKKVVAEEKAGYALSRERNADPMKSYFLGMIMRDLALLRYGKTMPQWNGKDIKCSGGSQGGFQCILMAALDSDVTLTEPNAPWMCGLGMANRLQYQRSTFQPAFVDGLRYFDCVNHAKRIRCKVDLVRAGLGDYVCPPSGIAAFWNNLQGPRRSRWVQGSTHQDWGTIPNHVQKQVITVDYN